MPDMSEEGVMLKIFRGARGLEALCFQFSFQCYKKQCKTVHLEIFGPFSKQCPIEVSVPWGSVPRGLAVILNHILLLPNPSYEYLLKPIANYLCLLSLVSFLSRGSAEILKWQVPNLLKRVKLSKSWQVEWFNPANPCQRSP